MGQSLLHPAQGGQAADDADFAIYNRYGQRLTCPQTQFMPYGRRDQDPALLAEIGSMVAHDNIRVFDNFIRLPNRHGPVKICCLNPPLPGGLRRVRLMLTAR